MRLEPYAVKAACTVPRGEGGRKAILLPDYLDQHFGINQIIGQAAQTGQTVSRLEDLIGRGMVRLDSGPKRLLDAIKVVARNEFYRALAPFRKAYDNYRDDHEHFRRLTQSAGVLRWGGQAREVHLLPAVPYGATLRRVWETVRFRGN